MFAVSRLISDPFFAALTQRVVDAEVSGGSSRRGRKECLRHVIAPEPLVEIRISKTFTTSQSFVSQLAQRSED